MIVGRIRVSGELGEILFFIGIVAILGTMLTGIVSFVQKKLGKGGSSDKVFKIIEVVIWVGLIALAVLDKLGIFPSISYIIAYLTVLLS